MQRHILSLLVLLLFAQVAIAGNSESARMLVHTLSYLGSDYKNAVQQGKIVDDEEYEEMLEFSESALENFAEYSGEWADKDSVSIGELMLEIDTLVRTKADPSVIEQKCKAARLRVIEATGLKTYPSKYPSLENGKKVFVAECAKCHGNKGFGDGPEGVELNPLPRNFHDRERMNSISASHVFNTVRLGVEGTGMRAIPYLEDDEVWDVAFYVLSMRYTSTESKAISKQESNISLEALATLSDLELQTANKLQESDIALLRTSEEKITKDKFLARAATNLDKADAAYSGRDKSATANYLTLAYLEGIEPIELELNATDPALKERLEHQIQNLRTMLKNNVSEKEFSAEVRKVKDSLHEVSEIIEGTRFSFWMAMLMSISILLREGLEAFLVIMVMLSVLRAAKLDKGERMIHAGWILAVLAGVFLWWLSEKLIPQNMRHLELVEACVSFLAVLMLLYIGFWLHGKAEATKWKAYVTDLVSGAIQSGSLIGLMSLSFFVVFREVFESVLFLSALNIESAGEQSTAILLGVIVAFVMVMLLALVIMRFSAKLPIPLLFKISSAVMGILAVVLTGKGVHSLQEIGYVSINALPMFRVELLGFYPTIETCLAQLIVAAVVVWVWQRSGKK